MTTSTTADPLGELGRDYAGDEERPLGSYALILAVHTGVLAAALGLAARQGRLPRSVRASDLAVGAVVSFKMSRLLARSAVASPIRAPFTTYEGVAGPAELKEEVRGSGLRHALGELVTCPFCLGHWIAMAYCVGLVFAPRATRAVGAVLCIDAGADLLQHLHARLDD